MGCTSCTGGRKSPIGRQTFTTTGVVNRTTTAARSARGGGTWEVTHPDGSVESFDDRVDAFRRASATGGGVKFQPKTKS